MNGQLITKVRTAGKDVVEITGVDGTTWQFRVRRDLLGQPVPDQFKEWMATVSQGGRGPGVNTPKDGPPSEQPKP